MTDFAQDRIAAVEQLDFDLGVARRQPLDRPGQPLADLFVFLARHQAEAHLGHRLRGNDGLGPFAGKAAPDAVDLEGRECPDALEH